MVESTEDLLRRKSPREMAGGAVTPEEREEARRAATLKNAAMKAARQQGRQKGKLAKLVEPVKGASIKFPKGGVEVKSPRFRFEEDIIKEEEQGQYVILIPGGFKPPTGGHYSMIKQYEKNSNVMKVFVITGRKAREGITLQQSKQIFDIYGGFSDKVEFVTSNDPTPLRTCYELMKNEEFVSKFLGASFSIGASDKGNDPQRIREFVTYHENNPELTNAKIVAHTPAEAFLVGGKPASASRMRVAFQNGDWDAFKKLLPDDNFYDDVVQVFNQQIAPETNDQQMGDQVNENFFSMDSLFSLVDEILLEKKKPSETSLKKAHISLSRTARKKFPGNKERQNAYIYGTKRKMGWKPKSELKEQEEEADESQLRGIINNLLQKFLSSIPQLNNAAALQSSGMEYERDVQEPIVNTIMAQINRIVSKLERGAAGGIEMPKLEEMSGMAGGAVAGFSGPIGEEDNEEKRRYTSRA